MANSKPTIAVLGSGSWGTALAMLLARNGYTVSLWGHLSEEIDAMVAQRENQRYLPNIPLPDGLQPTADLVAAVKGADEVLVVVPSHAFSTVLQQIHPLLDDTTAVSWATKGLEPQSGQLLHEVAASILGSRPLAALSGPSFAKEVAQGLPTAVTVASTSDEYAQRLANYFHSDCFRAYTSRDLTGLEIGGAAKNVMAIGAGISDGLGFGANARAALITRGMAEITRFGLVLGGKPETFMGLGGMGDLVLTCTDDQSRNRRMGLALAKGHSVAEAKQQIGQEVEGVMAAKEIFHKAKKLGVEMPITEKVYQVLYHGLEPKQAVQHLLERKHRAEAG